MELVVLNQTNPNPALGDDGSEYMNGNNAHPCLSNAEIREAMYVAIDRERLAADLYSAAGQATCNLITGRSRVQRGVAERCFPDVDQRCTADDPRIDQRVVVADRNRCDDHTSRRGAILRW